MAPPGFGTGALVSEPHPEDEVYSPELDSHRRMLSEVKPPSERNLFNNNTFNLTKFVFNQYNTNACGCNASAAAYMYEVQRQQMDNYYVGDATAFVPSRLFLYYIARLFRATFPNDRTGDPDPAWLKGLSTSQPTGTLESNTGTMLRSNLAILKHIGVPDEQDFRYDGGFGMLAFQENSIAQTVPNRGQATDVFKQADDLNFVRESAAAQAPNSNCYRALYNMLNVDWMALQLDEDHWKQKLSSGYPIIFSIFEYPNAMAESKEFRYNYKAGMPGSRDKPAGGHSLLAVGYNDARGGYFLVQNS